MEEDIAEGNRLFETAILHVVQPEHDHPGTPEEHDVVAHLDVIGRVVRPQIFGIFVRPTKVRVGGETTGEPGVEHVFVLPQLRRAALRTGRRVFDRRDDLATFAVPHRDLVTPPELAADTPVTDVIHPVQVHLLESLRDDADVPLADSFGGGTRK